MSRLATAGTCNTVPTWIGSVPVAGHRHGGSHAKRPPRRLLTERATKTVVMELAEGTWDIEVPEPVPGTSISHVPSANSITTVLVARSVRRRRGGRLA